MKKYQDPPSDRLLPDLPPHARHIKTLVLDLDDVLVHSDWTRGRWGVGRGPAAGQALVCVLSQRADSAPLLSTHPPLHRGWRTFKRAGVEDFIRAMAQYYELVVYTSQLPTYADPILDRLDPQRMIQYR